MGISSVNYLNFVPAIFQVYVVTMGETRRAIHDSPQAFIRPMSQDNSGTEFVHEMSLQKKCPLSGIQKIIHA